jgi:DNA ligase (NAD+)
MKTKYSEQIREIEKHNVAYYVDDSPSISDSEYDLLFKELEEYESTHPDEVVDYSPTQKVNGEIKKGFSRIDIKRPMLSLTDIFTYEEFVEFDKRIRKKLGHRKQLEYCCELKLDGMALELRYSDGMLVTACSRGNGLVGEDLTLNAKAISNVPIRIHPSVKLETIPKTLTVRGEVLMSLSGLVKLNADIEKTGSRSKPFSNVRNAAAGTLRQLNPAVVSQRPVYFNAYSGLELDSDLDEQLRELASIGIPIAPHHEVCFGTEGVRTYYEKIQDIRDSLDFAIDGIVVKVNDPGYCDELGEKIRVPNWAVAFKFPASVETTTVTDITFQVGRTGVVTPVAEIMPIEIQGSVISRATLHNQDEFDKHDLHEYDTVAVIKAGDVIPAITQVYVDKRSRKARKFTFPTECPSCASTLVRDKSATVCKNDTGCPAQKIRRFEHFVSRPGMDIEGLAKKTLEELLEDGFVNNFNDLYDLDKEGLKKHTSLGPKEIENLLNAIEKSKETTLSSFIYSLGIKHVGRATLHAITQKIGSIEKLWSLDKETLLSIKDVGPEITESVLRFLNDDESVKVLHSLLEKGVNPLPIETVKDNPYRNKNIVITGSFANKTRDSLADELATLGAVVKKSVSSKTDFLLVGNEPGSNYAKALNHGVKIITEI